MTTYTNLELWAIASAKYYDKNEFVTVESGRTASGLQQQITGLQAEVLHNHSVDSIEEVGRPAEVFITPRDVYDLTVYRDLGTVRRRLDDLTEAGLLEFHGDVVSHTDGERRLYLPAEMDVGEVVKRLHELDGRPVPSKLRGGELEHVVPGDFSHEDGSVFLFDKDHNVQIDVGDPEDNRSIRDYVEQQLTEQGLTADIGNFYYTLRDRVGLTG